MKQTIGFHQFREAFRTMGRLENFKGDGIEVLFDFLEEVEQDTGNEIELDVIGLCCEYCQMSLQDFVESYNVEIDYSDALSEEDYHCLTLDAVADYVSLNSCLVGFCNDGSEVIFQSF